MKKFLAGIFFIFLFLLNFKTVFSKGNPLQFKDKKLRVGVAAVKITPQITETFTDLNKNYVFDGSIYNPKGDIAKGVEPFNDANNNGVFDGVWIAGYNIGRAASGILDDLYARCLIVSYGNDYTIFVVLDLVGFLKNRVEITKNILKQKGFNADKIIISSTHTHQGPDTVGIWGPQVGMSGLNKKYLDFIDEKIVEVVEEASKKLTLVKVKFAKTLVRDLNPYFNGKDWGGKNPRAEVLGLTYDARDPKIVDDLLLGAQFINKQNETIATIVGFSGHPEVLSDNNGLISSDYVSYLRELVEKKLGGTCVFMSADVGGMMSSLGSPIPLANENGELIYKKDASGNVLLDEGKKQIPEFAQDNLSRTKSLGYILGDAIVKELKKNKKYSTVNSLKVKSVQVCLPVDNKYFKVFSSIGLLELNLNSLPKTKEFPDGCIPNNLYDVTFGDAEFVTVPGELLPELAIELPKDFIASGKRPNKFFPQHKSFKENPSSLERHANPFIISNPPLRKLMKKKYKFIIGLADNEIGYIIPEKDFNPEANPLGEEGDHYEETNSLGKKTATILFKKYLELLK